MPQSEAKGTIVIVHTESAQPANPRVIASLRHFAIPGGGGGAIPYPRVYSQRHHSLVCRAVLSRAVCKPLIGLFQPPSATSCRV